MKRLPARGLERVPAFHRDFLQRLQAVHHETGADHVHARRAGAAQLLQHGLRGRLHPLGLAKARLKAQHPIVGPQRQPLGQQARGGHAFVVVRVAPLHRALRPHDWVLSFQSRFGKAKWVEPATQTVLEQLGRAGTARVDVVCPGFVV
ncbi:MAG: hypothetical protein E6Q65_10930, partial [Ottowia sp.]